MERDPFSSGDLADDAKTDVLLVKDELERINCSENRQRIGADERRLERMRELLLSDKFAVFYHVSEFYPVSQYTSMPGQTVQDKKGPFTQVTEYIVELRDRSEDPADASLDGSQLLGVITSQPKNIIAA
jgi:hypothetical protein